MKTNKITLKPTLYLFLFAVVAGCNPPAREDRTGYKSEACRTVIRNIDTMAVKFWDKSVYSEIKEKQIPCLKSESERTSANKYLEAEYSKVLVRDAKGILTSGCSRRNSHKTLNAMMSELKRYPKVPGLTQVKNLYKVHSDAASFIANAVKPQPNVDYKTKYDSDYETKMMQDAQVFLNKSDLRCSSLRTSLKNLTQRGAYKSRRLNHSQDVVKSYLECTDPAPLELNTAKYNLSYKDCADSLNVWKQKMDEHNRELNRTEDEEY